MADEKNANQDKSFGAAAGAQAEGSSAQQGNVTAQRGGPQADQISGQTQKGAHNQEMENRNPQGNKPDQNQSDRQQGNKF